MNFEVKGFRELKRKLDTLPVNVARRVLPKASQEGAKVLRREARRRAPRREGTLRRGLSYMRKKRMPKTAASYIVGLTRKAFYGMFIEFGTKHIPAKPFLRPALDEEKDKIINAMREKLRAGIEREAAKLGRR
jgi:HK97 gp10 family phage protein